MLHVILMEMNTWNTSRKKIPKNKSERVEGVEKLIKRKDDKLCVKWKGYDNSFNSWKNKRDSINE